MTEPTPNLPSVAIKGRTNLYQEILARLDRIDTNANETLEQIEEKFEDLTILVDKKDSPDIGPVVSPDLPAMHKNLYSRIHALERFVSRLERFLQEHDL